MFHFIVFRWQEEWARNQRGKGVFTDEQLRQMLKKSKLKDDHFWDDFAKLEKLESLLPSQAEKSYSSFEKFFVAQLDKIFPPKKDLVTVTSKDPKTGEKEGRRGETYFLFDISYFLERGPLSPH